MSSEFQYPAARSRGNDRSNLRLWVPGIPWRVSTSEDVHHVDQGILEGAFGLRQVQAGIVLEGIEHCSRDHLVYVQRLVGFVSLGERNHGYTGAGVATISPAAMGPNNLTLQ